MSFFRKNKSKEVGHVGGENPYIANVAVADDRYMNLAVERDNWRHAYFVVTALLVVSIGFNGYYMTQNKFVPYVVAVDKIGHIISVGAVSQKSPVDMSKVLRSRIGEWIQASRRITSEKLAQKDFVSFVYARVSNGSAAKRKLDDYYRSRNIWEASEKLSVSTEITLLLPAPGKTYTVEWTETIRNLGGEILKSERWKAQLTYDIFSLENEADIYANPEGLFIVDFDWSKQI